MNFSQITYVNKTITVSRFMTLCQCSIYFSDPALALIKTKAVS